MTTDSVLIYRPKKPKKLAPIFISLIFVIIGLLTVYSGDQRGWIVVTFFCTPLIINIVLMLPNSSYIRLSSEGIEIRAFYRSWFVKWYEVEQFGYRSVKGREMIAIKYSANHSGSKTIRNLNTALAGAEGGFDTLGNPPEEMVKVLNEWKERYAGKRHNR